MINLNIEIDEDFLKAEIKSIEGVKIHVGILDIHKRARRAKPKKAGTKAVGSTGDRGRKSGKYADITLGQLAIFLDARYGVFTDAIDRGDNAQLNIVTQELIKAFSDGQVNERRITNAATRFIKNPIQRKSFGSNSKRTKSAKGFDWPMVDTGTFFTNIKAVIKHDRG
ncbi:neck protein [Vibrio phage 1.259.O._10N.286.48.F4]|nr:neck protein [Vibrio phage 1.259.O._10N.286.48.F4]